MVADLPTKPTNQNQESRPIDQSHAFSESEAISQNKDGGDKECVMSDAKQYEGKSHHKKILIKMTDSKICLSNQSSFFSKHAFCWLIGIRIICI